jgi:hypothetical protein
MTTVRIGLCAPVSVGLVDSSPKIRWQQKLPIWLHSGRRTYILESSWPCACHRAAPIVRLTLPCLCVSQAHFFDRETFLNSAWRPR